MSDLDAAFAAANLVPPPLSPRREYSAWIAEAKRPDTRACRVAGIIERLQAKGSA